MKASRESESKCSLCLNEERSLTPEHVLPLWFSEYMRSLAGPMGFSWEIGGEVTIADQFDWTVPVCEPCNRWMNEWVEEPARRLLKELVTPSSSENTQIYGYRDLSCRTRRTALRNLAGASTIG